MRRERDYVTIFNDVMFFSLIGQSKLGMVMGYCVLIYNLTCSVLHYDVMVTGC